jgi:uncharacterized protein DUF2637
VKPSEWGLVRPWLLRGSAVVVAGVAAYASYEHQRHFALAWGAEAVSAALWPLSVDGLLVLASIRLLEVDSGTRCRVRCSVWAAFLLGVVVSLVANIAAAPVLTWQSVVVAGWPPIALLLAVELLAVRQRRMSPPAPESQDPEGTAAVSKSGDRQPKSIREEVRQVLESTGSALSNSEIVSALANGHNGNGDAEARLRRNVANSLWSLRRAGLVSTQDGRNVWSGEANSRT